MCECLLSIASSKAKNPNAGLGVLARKTFKKGDITGCYSEKSLYHYLASKEHTRKVYGDEVLEVDVARFSNYALRVMV